MAVTKMIEKGLGSNPTAKPKKCFLFYFDITKNLILFKAYE